MTQIVTGFCVGISMGTTVLIGHSVGARDRKTADQALGNSVWLFAVLAVILTPIMILGSGTIISIMQTPEEAVSGAAEYIRICGIGVPFIVAYNVISAIFRGDGNSRMPMVFIGIACVVNVVGDLLLTGLFGFGVVGVAIATVTAQAISSIVGILYLWKKGLSFPITKNGFKLSIQAAAEYLRTYSIDCIIVAFSFCLNGYFCGIDKSIIVFIHNSISAFGVRIPLAMLLSNMFSESMLPMGLAFPIGSLVSLAICVGYLLWLSRKHKHPFRRGVDMEKILMLDVSENGMQIGEKLFAVLDAEQKKTISICF